GVSCVAQIDRAEPGERDTVPPVACRHHAVEHVDATLDGFKNILWRAHAHEIARPAAGQMRDDFLDHRKHHRLRLAASKPADRIAVKTDLDQAACAYAAQVRDIAALGNAEQEIAWRRGFERALGTLRPAQRELHRAFNIGTRRWEPKAFV